MKWVGEDDLYEQLKSSGKVNSLKEFRDMLDKNETPRASDIEYIHQNGSKMFLTPSDIDLVDSLEVVLSGVQPSKTCYLQMARHTEQFATYLEYWRWLEPTAWMLKTQWLTA